MIYCQNFQKHQFSWKITQYTVTAVVIYIIIYLSTPQFYLTLKLSKKLSDIVQLVKKPTNTSLYLFILQKRITKMYSTVPGDCFPKCSAYSRETNLPLLSTRYLVCKNDHFIQPGVGVTCWQLIQSLLEITCDNPLQLADNVQGDITAHTQSYSHGGQGCACYVFVLQY